MRALRPAIAVLSFCGMVLFGAETGFAGITTGTWLLNQSNTFADGVDYGRVDIVADSSPLAGTVQFKADAFNVQPLYGTLSNFGIQAFGFNFANLTSAPSQWTMTLPSGWSQNNSGGTMGGFGNFLAREAGNGNRRVDPLVFTIHLRTPAEAVAANFAVLSTGSAGQGNTFFTAHVAGFGAEPSSHYIGAAAPLVPEPATMLFVAIASAGVVGRGARRAR